MAPRWTTDIFNEVAELGAQGNQDLILVLNRLCATSVSWGRLSQPDWGRGKDACCLPSRNGISSSRVRSGPRARAMVERRWMAFRRSKTSSC